MLDWQVWFHLNIATGALVLPATLEAVIRLRRHPSRRQGIILGLILGATVLVDQESAVLAVLIAAAALVPWLVLRLPGSGHCSPSPLAWWWRWWWPALSSSPWPARPPRAG